MDLTDIAQLASALATLMLAILTFFYVRATQAMVVEMRTAREEQRRPYVVLDIDYPRQGLCNLVMRNTGNAPAFDVAVLFEPDLPYQDSGLTLSKLPIFQHAAFFPDGKEVSFFLRSLIGKIPPAKERLLNATVKYRSAAGTWFEERFTLDPYLRRDLLFVSER